MTWALDIASVAHPHSRGENGIGIAVAAYWGGSSPLTRGKPTTVAYDTRGRRLIPTHAGKTIATYGGMMLNGAHPHSRGENLMWVWESPRTGGSSPLTRGKPVGRPIRLALMRLIPTHAGKTANRRHTSSARTAHPHSRGENPSTDAARSSQRGSSPLTRGKLDYATSGQSWGRLIPTHAGKTAARPATTPTPTAHPHSRGENVVTSPMVRESKGSSPLTRGKHVCRPIPSARAGLIPTHAGKTARRSPTTWRRSAHPHSRGENE